MITSKKLGTAIGRSAYWTVMHDGIEHAGYLAFLGWLSFFPFLVLMVGLAGSFGQSDIGNQFVATFINEIPEQFIGVFKSRVDEIVSGPPKSLQTISIIAMVWTASAAVEGLRTILNRAYRVETPPAYIWRRLMSIVQFLIITLSVVGGMFFLIVAPAIWHNIELFLKLEGLIEPEWTYIRWGFSVTVVFFALAASYYVLPNIKQKFIRVLPGTFVVMVLWIIAGQGLSAYINNFQQVNLVYGSLENIIVTLLFFYVLSVVYIFGAEFNYHIEQALGHKVIQKESVNKKQQSKKRRKDDA